MSQPGSEVGLLVALGALAQRCAPEAPSVDRLAVAAVVVATPLQVHRLYAFTYMATASETPKVPDRRSPEGKRPVAKASYAAASGITEAATTLFATAL